MKQETIEKIDKLRQEIHELLVQKYEKQQQIDLLVVQDAGDYTGKFVKFYDGNTGEYVFMKVENQKQATSGMFIALYGPTVVMDTDPLTKEEEIENFKYFHEHTLVVNEAVFRGASNSVLEEINRADFSHALEAAFKAAKDSIFA